jgi:hypothetical protein
LFSTNYASAGKNKVEGMANCNRGQGDIWIGITLNLLP